MSSPQLENGYTRVANEILEAMCRYRFPPKASLPMRLLLVVLRKTYGYQKKVDVISLSQFQKDTGENNRSNTVYWLNYLVQAQILHKRTISKTQVEYGLNKNYDQWLPMVQVKALVQVRPWGGASTGTETSASTGTHKRKKEIVQKKDAGDVPSQDIVSVIDSFKEVNPSYGRWYANTTQRGAIERLLLIHGLERLLKIATLLPRTNRMPYIPTITTPLQLEEKWAALEAGLSKKKTELSIKKPVVLI